MQIDLTKTRIRVYRKSVAGKCFLGLHTFFRKVQTMWPFSFEFTLMLASVVVVSLACWGFYVAGQRHPPLFNHDTMAGLKDLPLHTKMRIIGREEGEPQIVRVVLVKYGHSGGTLVSTYYFNIQPQDGQIFEVIRTSMGSRQIVICEPEADTAPGWLLGSPEQATI